MGDAVAVKRPSVRWLYAAAPGLAAYSLLAQFGQHGRIARPLGGLPEDGTQAVGTQAVDTEVPATSGPEASRMVLRVSSLTTRRAPLRPPSGPITVAHPKIGLPIYCIPQDPDDRYTTSGDY